MVVVRPDLAWDYLHFQLAGLSPGLEFEWFYIHNDIDGRVSEFIMQPSANLPPPQLACPAQDLPWVNEHVGIVRSRVQACLTGVGLVRAFVSRQVQPLQRRAHALRAALGRGLVVVWRL